MARLIHSQTSTSSFVSPFSRDMKMAVSGNPRLQTSVLTTPHPVSLLCSTVPVPKSFLSGTGRSSRRICTLILNCQRPKIDDLVRSSEKKGSELFLNSVSPFPVVMFLATLPGSEALKSALGPAIPLVRSLDLPDWLVHWGHPGNMAVVLFAMGGYGTYLGFRIRFSDDKEEIAKAKDLHPKLLGGMLFFFSLGALGGITSLLTSEKPILDSPHAVTAVIGLTLLAIQAILPSRFQGNPGLRNVHGILGSSIMVIFLVHAVLGLQLGLSF